MTQIIEAWCEVPLLFEAEYGTADAVEHEDDNHTVPCLILPGLSLADWQKRERVIEAARKWDRRGHSLWTIEVDELEKAVRDLEGR